MTEKAGDEKPSFVNFMLIMIVGFIVATILALIGVAGVGMAVMMLTGEEAGIIAGIIVGIVIFTIVGIATLKTARG